jgi:hypothetical protein
MLTGLATMEGYTYRWDGFMKYATERGSGIQTLMGAIHRQEGDRISLFQKRSLKKAPVLN